MQHTISLAAASYAVRVLSSNDRSVGGQYSMNDIHSGPKVHKVCRFGRYKEILPIQYLIVQVTISVLAL
jgi:hypothetical protein